MMKSLRNKKLMRIVMGSLVVIFATWGQARSSKENPDTDLSIISEPTFFLKRAALKYSKLSFAFFADTYFHNA